MQMYKNVIHPSLIEEDDETTVLSVIPPPGLHILMGVITKVYYHNYNRIIFHIGETKIKTERGPGTGID